MISACHPDVLGKVSQHLDPTWLPVTASQEKPASEMSVTVTENPRPPAGRRVAGIDSLMRGTQRFSAIALESGK